MTKDIGLKISYWLLLLTASCLSYSILVYLWLEDKNFFPEFNRAISVPQDRPIALTFVAFVCIITFIMGSGICVAINLLIVKNIFPNFYKKVN